MSDNRTLVSKVILIASAAFCIAAITCILYTRFRDSRIESIISGSSIQHARTAAPQPTSPSTPVTGQSPPAVAAPAAKEEAKAPSPAPMEPSLVPEGPEALSVRNTVTAFYNDYFRLYTAAEESGKAAPGEGKGARIVEFLYGRPDVDSSFAEKIDRLVTSLMQDPEIRSLPSDPLVMSRELPLEMQFEDPVIVEDKADIIAYTLWDGGKPRPVCLSLVKSDEVWKIENIIDMNLPGGLNECGGKKAGQAPPSSPGPLPIPGSTQNEVTPAKPPASRPTPPPSASRPPVPPLPSPTRVISPLPDQPGVISPTRPPSRSMP